MSTPAGSYQLGIDLGTTYTAAAVAREGQIEVVGLGNRAAAIPSVIHLAGDGTILTGEAASRRAATEADRVAREFKRRIGDPTPILVGGTPYSAEALSAKLLRWVIEKVSQLEGGPPSHLTVTYPANWGPYKQELFGQAIRLAGATATTLTEPEAAAIAYAANERVARGALVAVYDLGGGTFDAAVLRKTADGFEILGQPEGIERLGGIDFDEAVVGHVRDALGGALEQIDPGDTAAMAALAQLRRECVEAKEALSSDTDTSIAVLLPNVQTDVRLTRAEFEHMIRPTLSETVEAMRRALASASVEPGQITAVLLVGGSSRIPLVAELVSDAFGRPVAVDAHPKHAIALGAAHAAALEAARADVAVRDRSGVPVTVAAGAAGVAGVAPEWPAATAAVATPVGPPPARADGTIVSGRPPRPRHPAGLDRLDGAPAGGDATTWLPPTQTRRGRSRVLWPIAAVLALAVLGAGALALWRTGLIGGADPTRDPEAPEEERAGDGGDTAQGGGDGGQEVAGQDADRDSGGDGNGGQEQGGDDQQRQLEDAGQGQDAGQGDTAAAGVEVPAGEKFVTIDGITLDGDTYVVDYTTYEYEAELPGQHVHFFFDTVPPEQAGVPGDGPWILYGGPSPFTEYTATDRPNGATQMCALVANPDHSVIAGSGTCVDLPDEQVSLAILRVNSDIFGGPR
jgi:actin-like ATPase involved in cell morphogenesis